jgi:phycoerythrocyanin alpha-cysteine-84 phycoviolobilin lyase/isomerase subunit PecE
MTTEPILSPSAAIAALNSDDNQLRYYAAWWLGKHKIKEATLVLCECLKDEKYRTTQGGYPLRRQAARTLGLLKNREAVPALLEALSVKGDLQLQEAVIQALASIGDRICVPNLLGLLQSDEEKPLEALIEALGSFQVKEASSLIEPFLRDSSERVQCAAARYFYQVTQERSYLERIIKNLNHDNPYLRWAAAFDLGAIAHVEATEAIIQAKIANSLKLLNLKRILEALLNNNEGENEEAVGILFGAIDGLLIQL